ncbi:MAG: gamma-glutamyl-gamma-aminobutyrate hydrolase family protein, partial [Parabacteroides sp.]
MKRLIYTFFACFLISGSLSSLAAQQPDLKSFNALIDSCNVNLRLPHKPLIGISIGANNGRLSMSSAYVKSVLKAGGAPILIPTIEDGSTLRSIVADLDGLILTGGEDVNPLWYKEEPNRNLQEINSERDSFELTLIKLASDRNIPILGICRGEQIL